MWAELLLVVTEVFTRSVPACPAGPRPPTGGVQLLMELVKLRCWWNAFEVIASELAD
jgi:hypothetical protein